jgi:hypothetical protein
MEHLEAVLADRAHAMGVEVRRGHAVDGVAQAPDGVTVRAGSVPVRARWLVGCDGGRSTVRKAAGFEFVGTEPEFTGYSIQVEMASPNALTAGRHYTATGMYTYQPPGIIAMADFDEGAFHRTESITLEHVQSVLRRVSGVDVTITALHLATTWTDRAFQATAYRKGRVVLAGDACHIHSPLGGQGLNLGLGDAMNLGWTLASVIRARRQMLCWTRMPQNGIRSGRRSSTGAVHRSQSCGRASVHERSKTRSLYAGFRAECMFGFRRGIGARPDHWLDTGCEQARSWTPRATCAPRSASSSFRDSRQVASLKWRADSLVTCKV